MKQVIFISVDQCLPACIDHIGGDADGAEGFGGSVGFGATAFDHYADLGGRLVAGVDDADLVVRQVYIVERGVMFDERLAERAIEGVDRAVSLGDAMLDDVAAA